MGLDKKMGRIICIQSLNATGFPYSEDYIMAHKKIERKKELDRRRKRRQERLKERIREARAAGKNK